jgi:uncharacterized protein YbjT (DUF2867 family)
MVPMNTNQIPAPGPVAVTGAHGKTGRRVAARLVAGGVAVRPLGRTTATRFDWGDPTSWPAALDGARAAYLAYQPDLAFPGGLEAVTAVAAVAAGAGVERAVLLSGRGEPAARECELAFLAALPQGTVVRCAWFDQNFTEGAFAEAVAAGVLALPCDRSAAEPFVDAEDIADVAVAALSSGAHAGMVHELTGPEALTFDEVAATLSEASGRRVDFTPVSAARFAELAVDAGMPPGDAGALAHLFGELFDGRNTSTTNGIREVLGREPRSFGEFARRVTGDGARTGRTVA